MRTLVAALALLMALLLPGLAQAEASRPPLVVLMVVDQLRADHLLRFEPWFLPPGGGRAKPGGFRYLMERGAHHRLCRYDTLPTYTAVGHAVISTGGAPYAHGIIGNRWYDRTSGKVVTSVGDPEYALVGNGQEGQAGASPVRLDASTVGDELKLSNHGQSRVYSVSMKDRASILLAGHGADLALWFDFKTGRWVTSRWYRPDGTLPAWAEQWNREDWLGRQFGWTWTKTLPEEAYRISNPDGQPGATDFAGLGTRFPHRVTGGLAAPGPDYWEAVADTPLGNTATLRLAGEIVRRERLGRGPAPDLLTLNLTSYDRAGHAFGPYSPQIQDMAVRLDRDLAEFFALLDREVGLERTVVVLTGDHGCAPLPEVARDFHLDAGRASVDEVRDAVQGALEAKFGAGRRYVKEFADPNLYLDPEALPEGDLDEAREVACSVLRRNPAVFDAYTRDALEEGELPRTEVAETVSRSFHRVRSGDVFVVMRPFWFMGHATPEGSAHGAPWSFDAQVPLLLAGPGIRPGERLSRCSPRDIAPTLSTLLRTALPSASSGRILEEDLVPADR